MRTKTNQTQNTAASMKSDKMLWKCYTVYNEHLKRDFTTILRDCTQSPNKTLYLSNELQNFSIPSLIFFLSLYWLLQIPLLCWDFLRFMHFSLFQKNFSLFQPILPRKFFTIFQTMFLSFDKYIYVENYTSNQTAREKKTKLVL